MVDLCMVRHERYRSLVPATDLDHDRLARIPRAQPFEVLLRFSRTSKLNRWYRGLVGKVAEAIDVNPDALHADLKFKAGLIERIIGGTSAGLVAVQLRSTAFPAMEDVEFSNYCDVAVELLHRDYLPHVRAREWQKLIIEWAGRRPAIDAPQKLLRI
jgi:hypothetical protein